MGESEDGRSDERTAASAGTATATATTGTGGASPAAVGVAATCCGGAPVSLVDAGGRPLAGAVAELRVPGLPRPVARATSDARGVAAFGLRAPGLYWLDAHHAEAGSTYARALLVRPGGGYDGRRLFGVAADARRPPGFELRSDATLVLRLHDGRRGLGGVHCFLRAGPQGPWVTTLRRTDERGWLRVDGLPPGPLQLELADVGWWTAPLSVEARVRGVEPAGGRPRTVRVVRRGAVEIVVRGLDRRALTATRRRTRVDLSADGLGGLEQWLAQGLVRASTIDGRPDRRGRVRFHGVPAVPLRWRVARGRVERGGVLRAYARRTVELRVDLAARRRCLVPHRSATTGG